MLKIESSGLFSQIGETKRWRGTQLEKVANTLFSTHRNNRWNTIYNIGKKTLTPWKIALQLLARVLEPRPGQHKEPKWIANVIRMAALLGFLCLLPMAMLSLLPGMLFHSIGHSRRPYLSYIKPATAVNAPLPNQLHIRTHNLGFVHEFLSTVGDLRPVAQRAREVVQNILTDQKPPDIICFQEAFHTKGTKILCEGIREKYPYIIHSIAPHILGLNSGALIASRYPIQEVSFRRFRNLLGPEKLSTRGLLAITVNTEKGPMKIYNTHLQALIGKARARAREKQLEQIIKWMREDKEECCGQILTGDFNACKITAWGETHLTDEPLFHKINSHFINLFELDHDPITGERTKGAPLFLPEDNRRMPLEARALPEPRGTWYTGPFAKKGLFLRLHEHFERRFHKQSVRKRHPHIALETSPTWGTKRWLAIQQATTARFDQILLPKDGPLKGTAEIRRVVVPDKAQSAPTDHLPIDAIVLF